MFIWNSDTEVAVILAIVMCCTYIGHRMNCDTLRLAMVALFIGIIIALAPTLCAMMV